MTPKMLQKCVLLTVVFLLCTLAAADNTTQKAVPLEETATRSTPSNTTTSPPKVNVLESVLCKKCICDKDVKQLDCSQKNMNQMFTNDEWNILQNGDFDFETIKLEHNNISKISEFHTYPVKNLYLAFNQISSIEIGAFQNLSELTKLDLSHNKLTSKALVPDVFKGVYSASDYLPLDKMRELDLGYNLLHNLDADLFEHVPKLEMLTLCGNTFQVIDTLTLSAITGLSSLKTLDMSYMEISEYPDNFLHGPRDLETLILSGNLFDELPDDLDQAINLKELVLDENPIGDIVGENVFPVMKNLQYLSISYMPDVSQFGAGAFSNLQNLQTLIASNNPNLTYIDVRAFARNTTNPEIFDYPPLEKLYLHNNNLTTLDHDMLERWDKISVIDLRYNEWTCDCNNRWLIHTLLMQINNTTPQLTNDVTCYEPKALRDISLMQLNAQQKVLVCNWVHGNDSLFLIGLLVGILICIPIVLGSLALWRRGCFGVNRTNCGANRALYDRASFSDDLHI